MANDFGDTAFNLFWAKDKIGKQDRHINKMPDIRFLGVRFIMQNNISLKVIHRNYICLLIFEVERI